MSNKHRKYLFLDVADLKDDLTTFKTVIYDNIEQKHRKYIDDEWIEGVAGNPTYAEYAVQSIIYMANKFARRKDSEASNKLMTGYFLPAVDAVSGKERFGSVALKGIRIPFLTMDGEIVSFLRWRKGNSDKLPLSIDAELPESKQRKIAIPYLCPVKVMAKRKDDPEWGLSYEPHYLVSVNFKEPLNNTTLKNALLNGSSTIDQLTKENHHFKNVVLRDTSIRFVMPLQRWEESKTETVEATVFDPVTRQPIIRQNPTTKKLEKITESKAKMVEIPEGQPYLQTKSGSEGNPQQQLCLAIRLGNKSQHKSDNNVTVNLWNNRVGSPVIWLYGLQGVVNQAKMLGIFKQPEENKDPFEHFNQAYIGSELIVLGYVTDWYQPPKSQADGSKPIYIQLSGMMIITTDFEYIKPRDKPLPYSLQEKVSELIATGVELDINDLYEQIPPIEIVEFAGDSNAPEDVTTGFATLGDLPTFDLNVDSQLSDVVDLSAEVSQDADFTTWLISVNAMFGADDIAEEDILGVELAVTLMEAGLVYFPQPGQVKRMETSITPDNDGKIIAYYQSIISADNKPESPAEEDISDEEEQDFVKDMAEYKTSTTDIDWSQNGLMGKTVDTLKEIAKNMEMSPIPSLKEALATDLLAWYKELKQIVEEADDSVTSEEHDSDIKKETTQNKTVESQLSDEQEKLAATETSSDTQEHDLTELNNSIKGLMSDDMFSDLTFDEMFDLGGMLPNWVTKEHKSLIEGIIKKHRIPT